MRIKDTLNLGKTKFKMRGNLPVKELEREKLWEGNQLYQQRQKLNEGKPSFVLHDGPPYANGDIHMGHAMNKITKDFIVRYKSMNGFRAPFVPGWDTHGLPIEQQLKKAGYDRKKMSTNEFRKLCHDYALKQVDRQRTEFKRLGLQGDWDNPYLTLMPEYEAAEARVFGRMAEKGLIYKGLKPIIWSWSSESALAEAEIEYHDVESPSAFFAEKVIDGKGVLDDEDTYMLVWTTTPWTIPASEGITVAPDFDYAVVQHDDDSKKYVIGTELLDKDAEMFSWKDVRVLKTIKGKDLDNVLAEHPFDKNKKLVTMEGDFVTNDAGTGLVHTAPGYGEDDYNIGKQYGLPIFAPVDNKGYLTKEAGPDFEGVFYEDANQVALDKLKEQGQLVYYMPYEHSYPFDWRTKKPVIYRATPQWFALVDKIRDQILDAIKTVDFKPDWGQQRLYNMIRDRGDWVISRQRVWGVPLPIFYGEDGEPIITKETVNHVADLFGKYGSDIWFERDAKDLLPDGFTSEHSPNGKFTKENDIMDVWFDSGSSHQGVLAERPELTYPADLYLEGSDQYRGWFNSSLITSVAYDGISPYKTLLSQGFTLDGKGHKMSKSLGNTIAPADVIKQMGADIIRLWVTSVDTSADVRVLMGNFKTVGDSYKKIRNTIRYMLANTSDFNPEQDSVSYSEMNSVDQFMLVQLNKLIADVKSDYDNYDFMSINKKLMQFITVNLSAFYLDFAKDILYIDPKNSKRRRSMQTVLYQALVDLTKLMTPIIPHTTEEIWEFLKEPEEFVQLAEMPSAEHFDNEAEIESEWNNFLKLRKDILKAMEDARDDKVIGKPSEAKLILYVDQELKGLLNKLDVDVAQILMVSQLEIKPIEAADDNVSTFGDKLAIEVEHADGKTCERCRMIKTDVGSNPDYPEFCARCAQIVQTDFPETATEGFEEK
ncbi:isoleucine--tRNA ligase [Fructilactobacillus lindneri]|uniref:Isoleucine--tRNA ligase n=2 Tax=Fructilactobacillus lindneri TaxID=53444 RepID=A0A0R2JSI2_9LACO|nr:isoleucine--tRNA ligase [Fructilactobacillus lindneri]ANZ58015.1 isoleucine--tRNA ligase [Fructilactobacillus lindneri]ANZ59285.1 isoleucine--tRNA ligase [Fructilactobacillus lindneri]KRN78357.1 Isoleucyl-tRNA synthetase [Fructilactobacillus lindneri DSM 20690 = JCM 11027]POG98878.1 isoleucine--tRNA ligase [Fructilactobacillus lindneri]POH00135.1 isoleucine--tRNA ligase [Fructilactobacillus lindneri]